MNKYLQKFDLTGRVALVTGGAGLLGVEFCRTLAEAGAALVIADMDGESAYDHADSLVHSGYQAIGIHLDVTSKESIQLVVDTTLRQFERLDILVNSAAMDPKFDSRTRQDQKFKSGSFEDYPLEAWNQALNVNLTGMFLTTQAAVRPMLQQGAGVIVNLCSIYGLTGPDQRIYEREGLAQQFKPVYYSVTKAGVLGLTRYLATYYAGKGVRVNALTPGGVYNDHDDEFVKAYSARAVLGRMADKDEMNGALLFLASEASSYMTGANLVVDGGWTAW
jgi:2-deoxy-D-gluconate 3-dehydrogenase